MGSLKFSRRPTHPKYGVSYNGILKLGSLASNRLVKLQIRSSDEKVMIFPKFNDWSPWDSDQYVERSIVPHGTTTRSTAAAQKGRKVLPRGFKHAPYSKQPRSSQPTKLSNFCDTPSHWIPIIFLAKPYFLQNENKRRKKQQIKNRSRAY